MEDKIHSLKVSYLEEEEKTRSDLGTSTRQSKFNNKDNNMKKGDSWKG